MIRDPGPIKNLGYSVTSRDIPNTQDEERGDAPNSTFVSRALNNHPVLRFLGTAAATMGSMFVLSKVTKQGGLRLAKTLQDQASVKPDGLSSRALRSLTEFRRELDALEGVSRSIDGVDPNQLDPYSQLVFERGGKLTTGTIKNNQYFTKNELAQAGKGTEYEPAAIWSARDSFQARMVKSARRLPYELPALYVGQKALVDPIFGGREDKAKVNWYNPVDVVTDFVKESSTALVTMMLPFEAAGAAAGNARHSIMTFRQSMGDVTRSMGVNTFKTRAAQKFVDLSDVLSEVGHDLSKITNQALKVSAQTSGGIQAATKQYYADRPNLPAILSAVRNTRARESWAASSGQNTLKRAATFGRRLAFGDGADGSFGYIDLLPGLRGLGSSVRQGINEFRKVGAGYDVINRSVEFDAMVRSGTSRGIISDASDLTSVIKRIQSGYGNRMSRLAQKIESTGGGGVGSGSFYTSEFFRGQEQSAYKEVLQRAILKNAGRTNDEAFEKLTNNFVNQIHVERGVTEVSRKITIGKTKILKEGDEAFEEILTRFSGTANTNIPGGFLTTDALRSSIDDATRVFEGREFQAQLRRRAEKAWSAVSDQGFPAVASKILKTKKASFEDFSDLNNLTSAKRDFLIKRSAQRMGVQLKHSDGRDVSEAVLSNRLAGLGIDTSNLLQMRSFLVREKQISSGIFAGGYNILGLRPMTLDEGFEKGIFSNLTDDSQNIIRDIGKRVALQDPTTTSASVSVLRDTYVTRSGNVLDFSGIRQSISNVGNFFARDLKIPILNFNPAQMLGKGSFDEMSGRAPFQIVQGKITQPFLSEADQASDFYLFFSGGRTKGQVMAFNREAMTGGYQARQLEGFYRPLKRGSLGILSRQARNAASEKNAKSLNELNALKLDENGNPINRSKLFKALRISPQKELQFREKFDIDFEQPNSLPGLLKRFAQRKTDVDNPAFFARILKGETVNVKGKNYKLDVGAEASSAVRIVDDSGAEMISEGEFLRAFERFRKSTFGTAMPRKAMKSIEDRGVGTFYGQRTSDLNNAQDTIAFAQRILARATDDAAQLRSRGFDTDTFYMMGSRIRKLLEEADLMSGSHIAAKSPTILTREDQLKDEIFRYLIQRDELLAQGAAGATGRSYGNAFIQINQAISEMSGQLPAGQLAEAQAAAFSTLLNLSSFRANRSNLSNLAVQRGSVREAASIIKGNAEKGISGVEKLLDPYVRGTTARIGEIGKSGLFKQLVYPKLSTAPYSMSDFASDALGSTRGPGADVLLTPTFGTVFGRDPFAAIKSVLGINTFNNTQGYSSASAAFSHGVERLNKYFGTLGLQLDVNKYSSPLSLFASGMVGKRVLPIYAAGTGIMTVDRTIGGMVNEKDERGERVYSPFFIGGAAKVAGNLHALGAGITPGGMNFQEKKEQLFEGEVAIRQGRFWPLGNTPFMGGKIMYYRPSIYRKIEAGAMFTSDTYGSPIEKALFYTDISPLRPFDPYRFERKHFVDRPYPVTGEYFSGPFGPLVPALNATVGRILKPETLMHERELAAGLANYAPAGQSGAYNAAAYISGGMTQGSVPGGPLGSGMPIPVGGVSSGGAGGMQASTNAMLAGRAGALNTAQADTRNTISSINNQYLQMAYGPSKVSGVMPQRIIPAGAPLSVGNVQVQSQELGYRTQEMLGIYGFGIGTLRENFGYGQSDFAPQRSVLQAASKAYGTSRQFWDLNLGGLGDIPLMSGSQVGSLEFSEVTRRFIPKERTDVNYINPIRNLMGQQYPFLPGPEYFTDFTTGDPFAKVQEGELRLPGVAYERLNRLRSDETGRYGLLDQYKILGDVAPYSRQYRALDKKIDTMVNDPADRIYVQDLRERTLAAQQKRQFTDYKYRYQSAQEAGSHPLPYALGRAAEYIAHRDTFINRKFLNKTTAVEDWERNNVYGATFPEWQRPVESFIEPMINKAANRNPLAAASALAVTGTFFGKTAKGKLISSAVGAITGLVVSSFNQAKEAITGEKFIPETRKKELALEEYADILTYVKNTRLANMAEASGDRGAAFQFRSAAKRTMYGAPIEDINSGKYGTDIESLSLAIPKRKREHFKAMINAPVEERQQILSTAGRLERRIYQAAWGMNVERRPDLVDYFSRHELPAEHWEGWHPNTNMDQVKIKMGQSMGLQMSQMGYYPQQIQEANLTNPSYPKFGQSNSGADIAYQLRSLMNGMGVTGTVTPVMNPFGSQQIDISAGVR